MDDAQQRLQSLPRTVAAVAAGNGRVMGTAFFIGSDGHLLTCEHVVRNSKGHVRLKLQGDTETVEATVVEVNAAIDAALLRIDRTDCPALPVSADWRVGLPTSAYGFPRNAPIASFPDGIPASFEIDNITKVSGTGQGAQDALALNGANVDPGMSGSPLVCRQTGHVLGLIRYRYEATEATFATPVQYLSEHWPVLETIWSRKAEGRHWGNLPYSLDRGDQIRTLIKRARACLSAPPRRPLFAIVHGSDRQCPDAMIDVFKDEYLPLLATDPTGVRWKPAQYIEDRHLYPSYEWIRVDWPREAARKNLAELNRNVAETLASLAPDLCAEDPDMPLAELIGALDLPVLIRAAIGSEFWQAADGALLQAWARYWQGIQLMRPDSMVIVFLVVCYRAPPQSLFGRWFSPLQGIRRALAAVGEPEYVLPELDTVARLDGEEWIRELNDRDRWRVPQQTVLNDLGPIYGDRTATDMMHVGTGLEGILNAHARQDRRDGGRDGW